MALHWILLISCFLFGITPLYCAQRNRDRSRSPPAVHPSVDLINRYVVVVGERLELPCKVTGNPKPFKVWFRNGEKLSSKFSDRFNLARNSLIINPVELNDTATYYCHTSNSLGEKWFNYTVEVKDEDYYLYYDKYEDAEDIVCEDKPKYTMDKTPGYWIARSEMSPLGLRCGGCGNPQPAIKWFKNGQYIDPQVKQSKYKVEDYGLNIDSLSADEAGNYTCVLENEHGTINFTYKVEVLISRAMPPVIVGPKNQTAQVGTDVRFECKVLASNLQHHIQWLQHFTVNDSYMDENGQPYVHIIQQSMENVTQPELLIIKNVTIADGGWYTCLVSNPMGRDYQSAWLTVKDADYYSYEYEDARDIVCEDKPKYTKDKIPGIRISYSERSHLELKCDGCGNPQPTIKWFKNGQYIDPEVKEAKYKVEDYGLNVDSVSTEEAGNYTCVLENEHGTINFTYEVEVLVSRAIYPVIVGPNNQTVQVGYDARFECKVLASNLQHHIQWLQHYTVNDSYRDENGQPYVHIIQQSMMNVTQPELLIIKNVTMAVEGWYSCLVSNHMDSEIHVQSAYLTVIDEPLSTEATINTTMDNPEKDVTPHTGLSTGAIVAIVAACAIITAMVIVTVVFLNRKNLTNNNYNKVILINTQPLSCELVTNQ